MTAWNPSEAATLPSDGFAGALAGRVFRPDVEGPSVVALREDGVYDVSAQFSTVSELCEADDPAAALAGAQGEWLGSVGDILANTPPEAARSGQTLAHRADRFAGDQGRRRDVRNLHARAGHRGARARKS